MLQYLWKSFAVRVWMKTSPTVRQSHTKTMAQYFQNCHTLLGRKYVTVDCNRSNECRNTAWWFLAEVFPPLSTFRWCGSKLDSVRFDLVAQTFCSSFTKRKTLYHRFAADGRFLSKLKFRRLRKEKIWYRRKLNEVIYTLESKPTEQKLH